MVQGKTKDFSQGYKNAIQDAIEAVWAEIADRHQWWFLRAPAPYKLSVQADNGIYVIKKKDVGRMLYISSQATGRKVVEYRRPSDADPYKGDINTSETGTPLIFTDYGITKGNYKQILIIPAPNTSADWYLHYCESGSAANLNKAPASFRKTIFHGVMSILAPPEERKTPQDLIWWKAVTKDEDTMYEEGLTKLIQQAPPAAPDLPTVQLDPVLAERLYDINTT
jgi:hypothetical protein